MATRFTAQNIATGLKRPSLVFMWLRRFFVFGGALQDAECMHLVRAWSSGGLPMVQVPELFPGIESCESVAVRGPEARTIGWSLDLQELVHILSIVRYTKATKILEIGTFDGFTALNLAANVDGEVCTLDLPPNQTC